MTAEQLRETLADEAEWWHHQGDRFTADLRVWTDSYDELGAEVVATLVREYADEIV